MISSLSASASSSSPSCRLVIRVYEGTGLPILNRLDNIYIQAAIGGIIHRTGPASSSTVGGEGPPPVPGTRHIQWNTTDGVLTWDISTHTLRKLIFSSPKIRLSILSSTYSVIDNNNSTVNFSYSSSSSAPFLTDAMGKRVMNHPEDVYLGHCTLDLSSILPTTDGRNPWIDPNYVHNHHHPRHSGNSNTEWLPIVGMNNAMVRMGAYITDPTIINDNNSNSMRNDSTLSIQGTSLLMSTNEPPPSSTMVTTGNDTSVTFLYPESSAHSPVKPSSYPIPSPGTVSSSSASSSPSTVTVVSSAESDTRNTKNTIIQAELSMNSEGIPVGHRGTTLYDLTITLQNMNMAWQTLLRQYTGPYWLSYKLFGVLVQTEAFTVPSTTDNNDDDSDNTTANASSTAFPIVSDTYTLRSCLPDIALFLTGMQPLYVYLCTPGVAIGVAEISFSHLLQAVPRIALPKYKHNQKLINIHKLPSTLNVDDLVAADPNECSNAFFLGSQMNGTFPFTQINGEKFSTDIAVAVDITLATRTAKETNNGYSNDTMKDTVRSIDYPSAQPYGTDASSSLHGKEENTMKGFAASTTVPTVATMDDIKAAMVEMITSGSLANILPSKENLNGKDTTVADDDEIVNDEENEQQLPGGLLCLRALRLRLVSVQWTKSMESITDDIPHHYPVNLLYQTVFYPPEEVYDELCIENIDDAAQVLNENIACEVPVQSVTMNTDSVSSVTSETKRIILHVPTRYISPNGKEYPVTAPGDIVFKISSFPDHHEYIARVPAATVSQLSTTPSSSTDAPYRVLSLALEDSTHTSIGVINLRIENTGVTPDNCTIETNAENAPLSSVVATVPSTSTITTTVPPANFDITTLTYEQLLRIPGAKQHIDSLIHSTVQKEEEALRFWRQAKEEEWLANKARVENEIRKDAEERITARLSAIEKAWSERENQLLSTMVRQNANNVAVPMTSSSSTAHEPVIPAGYINPANMTLDQLLGIPSAKVHIEGLLVHAKQKEEENLATWRRAREDEWITNKMKVEAEWRKEADEREQARMTMMEAAWADREAERTAVMVEAQERVREVESKLRKLLSGAETKLREAEKAKEDAARQAESKMADLNALQRRLREDTEHAMSNARQRETNANTRIAEMTTEMETIRLRCTQLEAEAVEARKSALSAPDAALRDAMAAAQAECSNLREALNVMSEERDKERQAKEDARMQVLRLAKEVSKLRNELEANKQLDMERLRVTWLSREERYVLDGDRSALREIRRAADTVRDQMMGTNGRNNDKENQHGTNSGTIEGKGGIPPVAGGEDNETLPMTTIMMESTKKGEKGKNSTEIHEASVQSILADRKMTVMEKESGGIVLPSSSLPVLSMVPTTENANQIIHQLKMERKALLTSDAGYTVSHPIIRRIDKALFAAEKAARGLSNSNSSAKITAVPATITSSSSTVTEE